MSDLFFVPPSQEQAKEDVRRALKAPHTRRIFRRMLSAGDLAGASMADTEQRTAYNEGLRAVAVWLSTTIEAAESGAVASLMRESAEERDVWNMTKNKERSNG